MEQKKSSFSFKSIRGILYQSFSVICLSLMVIVMRYLYKTTTFTPFEILIWRSFFLSILNIILASANSIDLLAIKQKESRTVFYRSVVGIIAVTVFFVSNYILPPSITSTILKLSPLITNLVSMKMMNEKVTNIEIAGMIVAFGGVILIIFDPSKINFTLKNCLGQLYLFAIPLFNAIIQSTAAVLIRMMGQSLHYIMSPTYFGISTTICEFPLVLATLSSRGYTTEYTFSNMFLVFLVGLLGWAGQVATSKALQIEKAARIAAINFDTVLFLLVDVFYFEEKLTLIEVTGIILIMTTVLGIAILKAFDFIK